MSNRFAVPDDSPPSTPDRSSRHSSNLFHFADNPSTTPAGPPPSSAASFTPAGAPSVSYMGSSLMKGMTAQKPASFGSQKATGSSRSKNPFARESKSPLGRSVRSTNTRQPSRLREEHAYHDEDEEEEEEDEDEEEEEDELPTNSRRGAFRSTYDAEDDEYEVEDPPRGSGQRANAFMEDYDDEDADGDPTGDMWLDMDQDAPLANEFLADGSDLMMLATPAANDRVRKEAEDLFRASAMRSGARRHEFKCATIAKDFYSQASYAPVTEPPELILASESLVARLYNEGVGPDDDEERLDGALATVTGQLTSTWQEYLGKMPQSDEEHAAEIGPGPHSSPLEKAAYLATLVLQLHHTRTEIGGSAMIEPLPETLFRWLSDYHNPYPGQMQDVQRHRPSPASHTLFWQTVFIAVLRGQVSDARTLLETAGWEHVKGSRRGELAYTGRALQNVQRAVQETCNMLEDCPGSDGNWDVWSSDWTLFRIRTRGQLDQLRRFAEGKETTADDEDGSTRNRHSVAATARKAESQVPWEIYEQLRLIFDIALGSEEAVLATAQDWCEATIGLFGWWDEGKNDKSTHFSKSHSTVLQSQQQDNSSELYLERLARSFQMAVDAEFHFNSLNPVELGMACVFEDNVKAVIAILRTFSLPVASAVAEIASLGHWLPPHQPTSLYGFEDLDMDDLEVLGVDPGNPDEVDGVKDNTLIQYAQELANYKELSLVRDSSGVTRDGWEVAIHVLGRMDSAQRSEETVGELVERLLEEVDVDSSDMVEKIWRLLNDLGMIVFAEQTAEHYGEILKNESHKYGEAMWYYALAHRPGKVREVMNLLIAHSLLQSVAHPPAAELDDHLKRLLQERNTTLEHFAKQDLEAAELLGKMLSGYATLRKFYEIRDDESIPLARRHQTAATALVLVIASSDDNIRGGLYDASRDAIVSEDFLLALLGEALVFVNQSPSAINLDQLDVLLKAVEDIQVVGSRVFETCDGFLRTVLASAPGLKGSTPADLLKKSTSNFSSGAASYIMDGSSMLASQLHRSISGSGTLAKTNVKRGWDWRSGLTATTSSEDILRILRLGLTKDMARLWLEATDNGFA